MQRKQLEQIAGAFKANKPIPKHYDSEKEFKSALYKWENMVQALKHVAAQNNPNFKPEKFLTACDY